MLLDDDAEITVSIIKSPWSRVANASALMSLNGMRPEIVRIKPEHRRALQVDEDKTAELRVFRNERSLR